MSNMNIVKHKNFIFVPGAQKSATTSVWRSLLESQKIKTQKGNFKEIHFLSNEKRNVEKNLDWYLSRFPSKLSERKFFIDASTSYLHSKNARKFMTEVFPNHKILVLLRDPIKRAYSALMHARRQTRKWDPWLGKFAESRQFSEILNSVGGDTYDEIVASEDEATENAVRSGALRGDYLEKDFFEKKYGAQVPAKFEDDFFMFKYIRNSCYSEPLKDLQSKTNEVKVSIFEKLIEEPKKELNKIYNFIGLEGEDMPSKLPNQKKAKKPTNKLAKFLSKVNVKLGTPSFPLKNMLRNFMKEEKGIPEEQYRRGRKLLEFEYEFWINKHPELNRYWSYDGNGT